MQIVKDIIFCISHIKIVRVLAELQRSDPRGFLEKASQFKDNYHYILSTIMPAGYDVFQVMVVNSTTDRHVVSLFNKSKNHKGIYVSYDKPAESKYLAGGFFIESMKVTATTASQLHNILCHYSGVKKSNILPGIYFTPYQTEPRIVDCPGINVNIEPEDDIEVSVEAAASVVYIFIINDHYE
ncbi:MAG: hypothetical protein COA79_25920 [Planctomycetota bacterium]|nr:MAG: hypothetical protein COA79_25920 [Planctomycetota bacterium]